MILLCIYSKTKITNENYIIHKISMMVWKVMAVQRHKLKEDNRFKSLWKLCRNLCSLRWLRPNLKSIRNFRSLGSKILYMLLCTGWIKDNNLLLNNEIDSEFLMLRSKLNESFRVNGKKRVLETIYSTVEGRFVVLMVGSHFGIKFIKQLVASSLII